MKHHTNWAGWTELELDVHDDQDDQTDRQTIHTLSVFERATASSRTYLWYFFYTWPLFSLSLILLDIVIWLSGLVMWEILNLPPHDPPTLSGHNNNNNSDVIFIIIINVLCVYARSVSHSRYISQSQQASSSSSSSIDPSRCVPILSGQLGNNSTISQPTVSNR